MADPKIVAPFLRTWMEVKLIRPSDLENNEIITRQNLSRILKTAERKDDTDESGDTEYSGAYITTINKIAAYIGIPTEALQYHPNDPRAAALMQRAGKLTIDQWLTDPNALIYDGIPATPEFKSAVQALLGVYFRKS